MAQAEILKQHREEAERLYQENYPKSQVLMFPHFEPNDVQYSGGSSEIHMDTTSVCIVGEELIVATNYKARFQDGPRLGFKAFNTVSDSALGFLATNLLLELEDCQDSEDPEIRKKARSIKKVVFLGIDPTPTNDKDNAAPHAEMQIAKHLIDHRCLEGGAGHFTLGVSRQCCPQCAAWLK